MTDDLVHIWINRDDAEIRGAEGFQPVLEQLDTSFLPRPTRLEGPGARPGPIEGYLDPEVGEALDRGGRSVMLTGERLWVDLLQLRAQTSLSLRFSPDVPAAEIRRLFVDLVELVSPTYARRLEAAAQRLHEQHYRGHERSFYTDGLYWLNYVGPDELERLGGEALAENPHAVVERLGEGLLLEVGADPLEAATPEGEERLVAATRMLPTGEEAEDEDEGGPEAANLVTVGGVRGFLDPVDNGFWGTDQRSGQARLDTSTLERLASLPGQGDPPVGRVHVLFSTQEAATANRTALEAVGATWYVDPESGSAATGLHAASHNVGQESIAVRRRTTAINMESGVSRNDHFRSNVAGHPTGGGLDSADDSVTTA